MRNLLQVAVLFAIAMSFAVNLCAQTALPGTEEFGLSKKELADNIAKVEELISRCMRQQGFEYHAVDYVTVKRGMSADKVISGLSEEEFIEKYGFGVATLYVGLPPQLNEGYSPARVGLGEKNIQIFKNLSPADQAAYNRALFGENTDTSFAVGLEIQDFSLCGGCTRKAIEEVFEEDQLKATYYNPLDAMINKDPRMKTALREFAAEMRKRGFEYDHPDEVETDIRDRLKKILGGKTLAIRDMTYDQRKALSDLRKYERRVGIVTFQLAEEIFDPVETAIEKELFARPVN